jgi:hypothetical protein
MLCYPLLCFVVPGTFNSKVPRFTLSCAAAGSQSVWVWVLCYDRRSVSPPCNKAPIGGLRADFYYCQDSCGFLEVWRCLWRENGSVIYSCCWPSTAQYFSGTSPVGLVTIFYCLRFETSLFVASCDSQGYGGVIRPRLHTQLILLALDFRYLASGQPQEETPFPSLWQNNISIVVCVFVAAGAYSLSRCLAINYSGSVIPAFRRHVTILIWWTLRKKNTE